MTQLSKGAGSPTGSCKWVDESEQKARNEEVKGNTQRSRVWNRKLTAILNKMDRHRDSALDCLYSTLDGATDPALVPVIEQLMLDRGEVLAGIAIKTLSGFLIKMPPSPCPLCDLSALGKDSAASRGSSEGTSPTRLLVSSYPCSGKATL